MNTSPAPLLVCYDGSPAAERAIDGAARLFPGRPAILYIFSGVAAQRVRTTSVERVRDELIEEVRVAARREAAAVAEEGTNLARRAGLDAKPLTVETREKVRTPSFASRRRSPWLRLLSGARARHGVVRG